jgi:hypothetical protein
MTNYDVVFKSRESYYRILKAGQLSWQKANVENSRKQPDIIKKKRSNCWGVTSSPKGASHFGKYIKLKVDR